MTAFTMITPAGLIRLAGTPDCPALLDMSDPADAPADPFPIPWARHVPHGRMERLAPARAGRRAVTICRGAASSAGPRRPGSAVPACRPTRARAAASPGPPRGRRACPGPRSRPGTRGGGRSG